METMHLMDTEEEKEKTLCGGQRPRQRPDRR